VSDTSWAEEYELLRQNPPKEQDWLVTNDGSPIRVTIKLEQGKRPFIFALCYLPDIVGSDLGWFCRRLEDDNPAGMKCIIDTPEFLRRKGLASSVVSVQKLRVKSDTLSGKALRVEVVEW
jgi:hypothetical protein